MYIYSLKEIVINLYCDFLQKSDCGIDACIFDCFLNTSDNRCKKFLDLFKNQVQFTKHIITEEGKEELSEELGITSYPTFLINNRDNFTHR